MSENLPVISGQKFVRFFLERGFVKKRQTGSHIILRKEGIKRSLVIPNYRELGADIILNNLKTAGISRNEFKSAFTT
ncbi:MAG: type II toxin-antitoxin system HicA family toxin [Gammaproteobacteria bacterium WSBS_2016_MAG_OTU1]